MAAVCDRGDLCLWDFGLNAGKMPALQDPVLYRLQQSIPGISLAFSADGTILLVGTEVRTAGTMYSWSAASELQVWDVPKRTLRHRFPLKEAVYACAVSPDGKRIAYSGAGGNDLVVRGLDRPTEALLFRGGQQIVRTAFVRKRRQDANAPGGSGYAFLFQPATSRGASDTRQFDPLVLEPPRRVAAPLAEAASTCGDWRGELNREKNGVQIYFRNEAKGCVQLDREKQGVIRTFCWVPDENGKAEAIALGSDLQCGIYLFGLNRTGPQMPLLRYYRGHQDAVTSLDVSGNGKYLLSASRDGTVRFWRLAGDGDGTATRRRWGVEIAVREGRAVVGAMDDLGPLYARGARPGDVIEKIAWPDPQGVREANLPQDILRLLDQLPWDTQAGFFTTRNGRRRSPFNCIGAWRHLLAVYMTQDDDWIAWTPAGYYACSAGGERLVGWQINRGLGRKPSFFTAEQFSKEFYRPDAIKLLLTKGSLQGALGERKGPLQTIAEVLPPVVRIVRPTTTRLEQPSNEITVTRRVAGPAGRADPADVAAGRRQRGRPPQHNQGYHGRRAGTWRGTRYAGSAGHPVLRVGGKDLARAAWSRRAQGRGLGRECREQGPVGRHHRDVRRPEDRETLPLRPLDRSIFLPGAVETPLCRRQR